MKIGKDQQDQRTANSIFFSSFVSVGNSDTSSHPKQTAISNAIVMDLNVGFSMPLSIVDKEPSRHFLHVIDSKYRPIAPSKNTSSKLPNSVRLLFHWFNYQINRMRFKVNQPYLYNQI
jgi:hypothetical protein